MRSPESAPKPVGVKMVARVLNLTPRRVQQLAAEGVLPKPNRGRYDLLGCVHAYLRYWQDRAAAREQASAKKDISEAELRRAFADAETAELKLARLKGTTVARDDYRRELARVLGRVRARFTAVPGEYAPQILEPLDMARATALLRGMVGSVLAELQRSGDADGIDEYQGEEDE